jgi:putative DNA primase/helicase
MSDAFDAFASKWDAGMRGTLDCRCASEIEIEPVEWLWPGRLARGKHTCIGGEPGKGKSQFVISVAATISRGGEWSCGEGRAPQGSVIILSAEDGASDTIVPRLHAAGADCGRVHIVSAVRDDTELARGFDLQRDLALLEDLIAELGDVVAVVIDPISASIPWFDRIRGRAANSIRRRRGPGR